MNDESQDNNQPIDQPAMDNQQVQSMDTLDNEKRQRLDQVRNRALQELTQIMPGAADFSPEKRFDIYMTSLQSSGDVALAESALESALQIENTSQRASALSELVEEVAYIENSAD